MHDAERDFLQQIDGQFPYNDVAGASDVIRRAAALSANAVFAVVDEITRPPWGADVTVERRPDLLREVAGEFRHPVAPAILGLAQRCIRRDGVSAYHALSVMDQVAAFPGLYAALTLAAMSSDDSSDSVDQRRKQILKRWERDGWSPG